MSHSSGRPPAPSLGLNAASIAGAEVVSRVAAALSFILLARFFTPDVYGQLAFAASLSAMAGPVVDFGLTTVAGARISREPGSTALILGQVWGIRATLALLSLAAIAAIAMWHEQGALLSLSLAYGVGLIPAAFATTWVAYQLGAPQLFLYEKVLQSFFFVALVSVAIVVGPAPLMIALAASASAFLAVGLSIPWVLRTCRIAVEWVSAGTRRLVAEARPVFFTLLPASILIPSVSLAVGWLSGSAALGLFWLAARLLVLGPIAGNFAVSLILPNLAAHPTDDRRRHVALGSLLWHAAVVALVGAWITARSADPMIVWIFGPLHAAGAPLVAWTGAIIGAEALAIIVTRVAPFFGTSGRLSRIMTVAVVLAISSWAVCWPTLGVVSFMIGIVVLHAAVLIGGLMAHPVERRSSFLSPPAWVGGVTAMLGGIELVLAVIKISPDMALAVRLIVGAVVSAAAARSLHREWSAPRELET